MPPLFRWWPRCGALVCACAAVLSGQSEPASAAPAAALPPPGPVNLADVRIRDACILPDPATQTYHLIASARGAAIRSYTSQDLITWYGPEIIYRTPDDLWGDIKIVSIWAPELHRYRDIYYLFLTFDTRHEFPEQWRNWLPRVTRGSQILVGDSPRGPFQPFENRSTLPPDMMTLDGTLFVEDSVPYMVFCHEWVQIKDGTVAYVRLKEDLASTDGEPVRLLDGSDGPWVKKHEEYGCRVTDGPTFHRSRSGKLFMLWTSGGHTGYTTGIAISDSGRLAGPWRQQAEPIFADDGGHAFLFNRFDGQLMMVLHSPNRDHERALLFELEDTGETLRIIRRFPAE